MALTLALGAVTWHDRYLAGKLEDQRTATALCAAEKQVQQASIATYRQASANQLERTREANAEALKARKAWAALKAKGYDDRPAVKPTDSPLAVCTGSIKWLADEYTKIREQAQ